MSAPEKARPRLPAVERRQAVLDTACGVFFEKSYRRRDDRGRSPGKPGSPSRSSIATSAPSGILYIACLEEAWRGFREFCQAALEGDPARCLGAISDAYMEKRSKLRVVDMWIQALAEASEDPVIAKAVRGQIRDAHDFFADVIRRGQADGVINADRDPVAEAWIFVAGGLLATIDHRLGGLLGGDARGSFEPPRRAWMMADPE